MMKKISVALALFFISSHANAKSQIVSDFELSLPRQFLQEVLNKKWESLTNKEFSENWKFPDQVVVSQGVPVHLESVELKIKTLLERPSLAGLRNVVSLRSRGLEAELRLGRVSVDHVISTTVGGVQGNFRIQAQCRDVVLSLVPGQGRFAVDFAPILGSESAGVQVENVDIAWAPGSWTSAGFQCEGVQGFTDFLQKEIENIVNDSAAFVEPRREVLTRVLQQSLQGFSVNFAKSVELTTLRPDIRTQMTVTDAQDLGESGWKMGGRLTLEFLKNENSASKVLTLGSSTQVRSKFGLLRLPANFIKEVLGQAYSANSWYHRVASKKVSGFNSLMQSRFAQFFVWPELMRFAKSSQFLFDLSSPHSTKIQGSGAQYKMEANLRAKMWAPKDGSYVPFMNFVMPFKSEVNLNLAKGVVTVEFSVTSLGLQSQWDPSYVSKYRPLKRFSSKTVQSRILQSLDGKSVSLKLPEISLMEGVSITAQKLIAPQGEDLVLVLSP